MLPHPTSLIIQDGAPEASEMWFGVRESCYLRVALDPAVCILLLARLRGQWLFRALLTLFSWNSPSHCLAVDRLYFIGKVLSAVSSANTTVKLQWLLLLQLERAASRRPESLCLHMSLELQATRGCGDKGLPLLSSRAASLLLRHSRLTLRQ